MDSELKIEYYIYDVFDNHTITSMRAEAEASYEEGMSIEEVHITTWRAWDRGISGQNVVVYDWEKPNRGE